MRTKKEQKNQELDSFIIQRKRGGLTPWKMRRIVMGICWVVTACSMAFGVYKNFTAVDRVTVKERETVVEKVENYAGIESFARNFAALYFSRSAENQKQMDRQEKLAAYLQKDLAEMNKGNKDTKKEVSVTDVQIWSVEPLTEENRDFEVTFVVTCRTEKKTETGAFTMDVHTEAGDYVVTKNPRVTSLPGKSGYEAAYLKSSDMLDGKDRKQVEEFLHTFFGVYPKAGEKELAYYVKDKKVRPIGKAYTLEAVERLEIQKTEEGAYRAACFVTYTDETLGVPVLNQYELVLAAQEDGELVILSMR